MSATLPEFLTHIAAKRGYFASDPYFCEPWGEVLERWGGEGARVRLWNHGAILLKPETAVAGLLAPALQLVRELGGRIVCAQSVRLDRRAIRDEWRYQINKASPERVAAMDLVLQSAPALYVLVSLPGGELRPAALRVSELKGPSAPDKRQAFHWRRRLGGVQDPMVNFFHAPDEPADLVRQWGVLFDGEARTRIYHAVDAGRELPTSRLMDVMAEVAGAAVSNSFELPAALRRISAVVSTAPEPGRSRMLVLADRLSAGERGLWPALKAAISAGGLTIDPQDAFTVAVLTPVMNLPAVEAVLEDDPLQIWPVEGGR